MNKFGIEILMDAHSARYLQRVDFILIGLGVLGIVLPNVITLTLSIFIAALFIISGLAIAYLSWNSYSGNGLTWLKPFILIMLGLLLMFYPIAGAAAFGFLLIIFFLMQGFAGISFAFAIRPMSGWLWTLFSGLLSLVLAIVFIVGWPFNAMTLVGLFIGISLLFEGIALLMLGRAAT